MSRVQLALNVSNLEEAIDFYAKLFDTAPAKVRPGYANFAIEDPALKLVLIETRDGRAARSSGALNHIGVELEDRAALHESAHHLANAGLRTGEVHESECCYALQEKVWIDDPDGLSWEFYAVLGDSPAPDVEHDVAGCKRGIDASENASFLGARHASGCC
jgi:catechol-2,3-dioxygenase